MGAVSVARPYQREAKAHVLQMWESGEANPMLVMGTGTGKTFTACHIIEEPIEAGLRVVVLAHREELLSQFLAAIRSAFPTVKAGIVQAGQDASGAQVVIASVDTLRSGDRLARVMAHGAPAVIIVDEAHHSTSPTHAAAIDGLSTPGVRLLGLTATPDREDGADLGERWTIAYSYGLDRAIAEGFLLQPFASVCPIDVDMNAIEMLDDEEMGAELLKAGIVESTVAAILQAHHDAEGLPDRSERRRLSMKGRSYLVFCASVDQARLTADALVKEGIVARMVCGATPKAARKRMISHARTGRVQCLTNPTVLTEGTDIPRVSGVVLARPLRSWSLYVQCVGRPLRPFEGQSEGLIIDLCGASRVHSLLSAPVLIGGSRCRKSPNGVHAFEAVDGTPKGECSHCGTKIACIENGGAHDFIDGLCVKCESPQCERSKDSRHHWMPYMGIKRICIDCGREVTDPHAGLLNMRKKEDTAPAEWLRVHGVTPETYTVDAGDHGQLYVIGDRKAGEWDVYWMKKRGRKPAPLAAGKIRSEMVRTWADDIARRARKYDGTSKASPRQVDYARQLGVKAPIETTGDASREIARAKARRRVLDLGLANEL